MKSAPVSQITIVVEGGMVTEVYTNLPAGIELEILDFDCANQEGKSNAMGKRLEKIKRKQNQLY